MCFAIPGKVKRIDDKIVIVDYYGEEKKAYNDIDNVVVGDYVYAQGGYVINRVPSEEAEEILAVWRETFFELQEVDLRLSRLDGGGANVDSKTRRILDRALESKPVHKEDLLHLMDLTDPSAVELLFKTANFLRQKYLKNSCCIHGILEISSYCREACAYCGLSAHHQALPRYRMTPDEIVNTAVEAIQDYQFRALVLQSGEDPGYSIAELAEVIRKIRSRAPAFILVSFGEVGIDGLSELFRAGARGLLMRFETSNPRLYAKLHPGSDLDSRILHIRKAYEMGYLIISGGLIGLPGQTHEDLVNDLFLAKELKTEMYSFGPFLPHAGTPLAASRPVDQIEVLKVLALARLIDPEQARVLVTTAYETLDPNARRKGLLAGASSVMLNVTPLAYRSRYDLYPDRMYQNTSLETQINETITLLSGLGRAPMDLGLR